jgi:hypothetical protein
LFSGGEKMPRHVLIIGMFLVSFFVSQLVQAAQVKQVVGKITEIAAHSASYEQYRTTSKGLVFIYMEGIPKGCGFGEERVAIGLEHPLFSTIVEMALSAKASGQTVELWYLNTCSAREGSWDFAAMWIK